MDITPINEGLTSLSGWALTLLLACLVITAVACYLLLAKAKTDFRIPAAISIAVIGIAGTIGVGAVIVETEANKHTDAVKTYISSLGFEIKDGGIAIHPGTDREITVSKNGEDYKCTSYAPESLDEKIFLVCDTAIHMGRGTIEDLSMQLNGMKIREQTRMADESASKGAG